MTCIQALIGIFLLGCSTSSTKKTGVIKWYQTWSYANQMVIIVLTHAIICVEVEVLFAKAMMFQVMVQHANDHICTFTNVGCLINQVVDLPWNSLVAFPNRCTLHLHRKYRGPGCRGFDGYDIFCAKSKDKCKRWLYWFLRFRINGGGQ